MIQPQTLEFLKELVDNNNREWFQVNKARFDQARQNLIEFTAVLIEKLHKVDPSVSADLDPKKCVMRIYRDIRFSKNKTGKIKRSCRIYKSYLGKNKPRLPFRIPVFG